MTTSSLNKKEPWPWREFLVVAVVPILLGLGLWMVHQESALSLLNGWRKLSGSEDDSWRPMKAALDYAAAQGGSIYQELFFKQQLKFQYPPSSLLLHQLLASLNIAATADLLNGLNWFLVLADALIASWFGIELARRVEGRAPNSYRSMGVGVLCLWSALCFYPVMKAYSLGQVQIWIDVFFTLTCISWLYQKKSLAGAFVGLICLIKPQFSLFFLWGMIRREKEFVHGWLAVVLSGAAVAVAVFGLANHLDYLAVLSSLSKTGESFHANQSINGILNRLLDNGPVIDWEATSFPPYNAIVRWGTLLSSAAIVTGMLMYRRRKKPGLLDLQLAALAFTIASPIAWTHHYGILPLVYIAAYFRLKVLRDDNKRKLGYWALAVSYLLTANYLGTSQALARAPLNLLYSYVFVGAVLLMLSLYVLTRSDRAGRWHVARKVDLSLPANRSPASPVQAGE